MSRAAAEQQGRRKDSGVDTRQRNSYDAARRKRNECTTNAGGCGTGDTGEEEQLRKGRERREPQGAFTLGKALLKNVKNVQDLRHNLCCGTERRTLAKLFSNLFTS